MEQELSREVIKFFGKADSVKNSNDKISKESRAFGFVEMPVQKEAQTALKEFDSIVIQGRHFVVIEQRTTSTKVARREFKVLAYHVFYFHFQFVKILSSLLANRCLYPQSLLYQNIVKNPLFKINAKR